MSELWKQYIEEMKILEGNVLNVCGKECIVEFQLGVDMLWQSWVVNEFNQVVIYFFLYVNVYKGNMVIMGGFIGLKEGDIWRLYSMELRTFYMEKVN